jgi:hypothetical protein
MSGPVAFDARLRIAVVSTVIALTCCGPTASSDSGGSTSLGATSSGTACADAGRADAGNCVANTDSATGPQDTTAETAPDGDGTTDVPDAGPVDPRLDCVVPTEPNADVVATTADGETIEFHYAWYSTAKGGKCGAAEYVVLFLSDAGDFVEAWPAVVAQGSLDDTARVFDTVLTMTTSQAPARESWAAVSLRKVDAQFTLHGTTVWGFADPPPGARVDNLQGTLGVAAARGSKDAGAAASGTFDAIWCEPVGGPYCE